MNLTSGSELLKRTEVNQIFYYPEESFLISRPVKSKEMCIGDKVIAKHLKPYLIENVIHDPFDSTLRIVVLKELKIDSTKKRKWED